MIRGDARPVPRSDSYEELTAIGALVWPVCRSVRLYVLFFFFFSFIFFFFFFFFFSPLVVTIFFVFSIPSFFIVWFIFRLIFLSADPRHVVIIIRVVFNDRATPTLLLVVFKVIITVASRIDVVAPATFNLYQTAGKTKRENETSHVIKVPDEQEDES